MLKKSRLKIPGATVTIQFRLAIIEIHKHLFSFQIAEYKATFDRFDADGNGSIDAEELGKLIRVLG